MPATAIKINQTERIPQALKICTYVASPMVGFSFVSEDDEYASTREPKDEDSEEVVSLEGCKPEQVKSTTRDVLVLADPLILAAG